MSALLELENVTKTYHLGATVVNALRGMSLRICERDLIAVLGPSGSGKTTFLNVTGLLDRPTEGHVYLEGEDVSKLGERRLAELRLRKIGFVFQSFNLVPWLTARQNVEVPLIIAGVSSGERRARAVGLLELVGLGHRLHHRPNQLSGGEQQRTAIARALANDPKIILADEPTGNLDSKTGSEIVNLLKRLNEERGKTLIVVTHNVELTAMASRVVHMKDGAVVREEAR